MDGDTCKVDIALIKATSSCLCIMLWQELLTALNTRLLTGWCVCKQVAQVLK
jgi:hypothetical protein